MQVPFQPPPRDPRSDEFLGEIPRELFDDTLYESCELVDRYALDLAYELAHALGIARRLESPTGATAAEIAEERGFAPRFAPALEWLLARLAADGALERLGEERPPRWRAPRPLRHGEPAELRALGSAIDPEIARTLDLLEAAASSWPAVAEGRATGEQELFGAGRIALWIAYFHNRNRPYSMSNRLTAIAVANRFPAGGRILEVGAGAGSATEALLEELDRRGRLGEVSAYDATEPSPFFRRRAERELAARFPGAPLRFSAFDIDRPADEQGLAGGYDVVLGVNVLHVARSLGASLASLRSLLAPGGWLIAGECVRLFPGQPVAADVVFQIFKGFVEVETDPELRPTHGFLEPGAWQRALEAAGYAEVDVIPDVGRIRDYYPRFSAAVVVGRAPGHAPSAAPHEP